MTYSPVALLADSIGIELPVLLAMSTSGLITAGIMAGIALFGFVIWTTTQRLKAAGPNKAGAAAPTESLFDTLCRAHSLTVGDIAHLKSLAPASGPAAAFFDDRYLRAESATDDVAANLLRVLFGTEDTTDRSDTGPAAAADVVMQTDPAAFLEEAVKSIDDALSESAEAEPHILTR